MNAGPHKLNPDVHTIPALDGVRGVAILAVMFYHFCAFLPTPGALKYAAGALGFGWSGVDLFFALSGFLITGILLTTKTSPSYYSSFYARRALRILPVYFLAVFGALAIGEAFPAVAGTLPDASHMPAYFTMLSNWLPVFTARPPDGAIGHLWSVALEEQFYLIWPPIVLILSARHLKLLIIGAIALSVTLRFTGLLWFGPHFGAIFATPTRCDGLLFGAFCAVLYAQRNPAKPKLVSWILLPAVAYLAIIVIFPLPSVWIFGFGITLLSASFAAGILYLARSDGESTVPQRTFMQPWLRTAGRYSYGMYVYHVPIVMLINALLVAHFTRSMLQNPWLALGLFILATALTLALAALSWRFIEWPILSLKKYVRAAVPDRVAGALTEPGALPSLNS